MYVWDLDIGDWDEVIDEIFGIFGLGFSDEILYLIIIDEGVVGILFVLEGWFVEIICEQVDNGILICKLVDFVVMLEGGWLMVDVNVGVFFFVLVIGVVIIFDGGFIEF